MRQKACLTTADVETMAAACKKEAVKNSWKVTIAITDEAGILLYLQRLDGVRPYSTDIALAKARTAALMGRPTKAVEDLVKARGLPSPPGLFPVQGAVPIIHQGDCIGAIGVSGAQSHEDEQIASAGIAALG